MKSASASLEDLLRESSASAARLAAATGKTVSLALLDGADVRYVDVIDADTASSGRRETGQRVRFWNTATGKALVAGLPRDLRQTYIDRIDGDQLVESGFADRQAFASHLDLIQARGYAIDANERNDGTSAVAAPVIDQRGAPVAAISIEGPGDRLPLEVLHELGAAAVEATRGPSRSIGGAPRPTSSSSRPSMPASSSVRVLAATRNLIGECPVYDADGDRLFWIDMYDPAIFRFDRTNGKLTTLPSREMITAIALHPEGMLIAAASGVWLIDPDTGARIRFFGHPERHIPTNRFNDGARDRRKRFWVNTVDNGFAAKVGSLYRMDGGGNFTTMDTGLTVPNGMGWAPDDRTMYLVDTAVRTIYAYDFDEKAGTIANRRVLVRMPENSIGAPDGLAVDAAGNLWVAMFDGWRVSQFSPEGSLLNEIVMPVPRPTSCTLGGGDNRTLFVTSARIRVGEAMLKEAPHSGAVFEVSV